MQCGTQSDITALRVMTRSTGSACKSGFTPLTACTSASEAVGDRGGDRSACTSTRSRTPSVQSLSRVTFSPYTMRRAWPPVYRPPPQPKVVSAAAVPQMHSPTTTAAAATRYRRESVAAATAAAGTCYVIAAPCSCSPPSTVRNGQQQQYSSAAYHRQHRGPPPPLPARNGGGCPYRCCADGRPPKSPSHPAAMRSPLQRSNHHHHHQQQQQLQQQQQQQNLQQQQQRRQCAYVRPRPSRSLENLLRVVELDDPAAVAGHRGVYEKSCHYGNPRRKMKVPGKENRHAWKRRSMESLLSARDVADNKSFEFFRHVRDHPELHFLLYTSYTYTSFFTVASAKRANVIYVVPYRI